MLSALLSATDKVDDLDGIPFLQESRTVRLAGDDVPVELYNHPAGTNPQLLEELFHAEHCGNLFLFPVDIDYHLIKKTVSGTTT